MNLPRMAQTRTLLSKRERLKGPIYWDKFNIVTHLQGQIGEGDLFSTMEGHEGRSRVGLCGELNPPECVQSPTQWRLH